MTLQVCRRPFPRVSKCGYPSSTSRVSQRTVSTWNSPPSSTKSTRTPRTSRPPTLQALLLKCLRTTTNLGQGLWSSRSPSWYSNWTTTTRRKTQPDRLYHICCSTQNWQLGTSCLRVWWSSERSLTRVVPGTTTLPTLMTMSFLLLTTWQKTTWQ